MDVPKGYTEDQVINIINIIVNHLANPFKFGYYDRQDMKQQGWQFALEAIPKYRPSKGQLSTFLTTHIRNRFINLKRDKFERHLPPCKNCPFYKAEHDICEAFDSKSHCDRWEIYNSRNLAKRSLINNNTDFENDNEPHHSLQLMEELHQSELIEYIDRNIPQEYRKEYRKLLDGVKLGKTKQEKLLDLIREILQVKREEDKDGS